MKSELEVGDDPVHCGIIGDESDHSHLATACRTYERINFIDLSGDRVEHERAGCPADVATLNGSSKELSPLLNRARGIFLFVDLTGMNILEAEERRGGSFSCYYAES